MISNYEAIQFQYVEELSAYLHCHILNLNLNLKLLSSPVGRHPCRAPSSPELSQSDIHSRTQSRTRQAASVAGEAVTIVEKPF